MDSKNYQVDKANAWNGWDPLKQVVLGNVFEPEFFEDIQDHKLRDLLQQLLYETHEDLNNIRKTLEDLGVEVIQPSSAGNLKVSRVRGIPKPWLMPRDDFVTLGDKILCTSYIHEDSAARKLFKTGVVDYWDDKKLIDRETGELSDDFWAPQLIRVGNKLIIDEENYINLAEKVLERYPMFAGSKITVGGHTDGVMNLPKPGLVVASTEVSKETFKDTLPGWDVCIIEHPNIMTSDFSGWYEWVHVKHTTLGRWWHPDAKSNPDLVKYVDTWLNDWVGYAEETVFEVNMLSVNEETILSMNYQPEVHKALEKHGIEPIYCRFRHRNFWDGGLHCLTLDTVREGDMQDYFA
jgi:hypothetical protein